LPLPEVGESAMSGAASSLRLLRLGKSSHLLLFTDRMGTSRLRYRMRDVPVSACDFRRRWVDSFEWAMMRHLCVSRIIDGKQVYMRDCTIRRIETDRSRQESQRRGLASKAANSFGLEIGLVNAARDCLVRSSEKYRREKGGRIWTPDQQSR
ncbi:MAG TPA: hypothetical protein PK442_15330, partial [Synergistales bacterium]|nr:hypothetical protein [Synergistales bacterium]